MTMMMTLQQAAQWLPGASLHGNPAAAILRVHTDTRTVEPGDLFVALKGETFDANDFLAQAKAKGAVATVCHSAEQLAASGLPGLVVNDTKKALAELASGWREQFKLPLIAVTGSNGKTTVTQMIASILRAYRPEGMLATAGNFNNGIGVPLTLLRLRAQHEIAVVELGMNHPGEIAQLAAIARPTVALVNNAQREHLEFMATVEAVALENGSVILALNTYGVAVFPQADAFTSVWHGMAGPRPQLRFALATADTATPRATGETHIEPVGSDGLAADVTCTHADWADGAWAVRVQTPAGALAFALHVAGLHNVKNALAATACTLAAGVPLQSIARGLEAFEPVKGRSRAVAGVLHGHPYTLVDDTYNANPDSVRAAIDVLAALPGPRLLVLGDMGEVGNDGPQFHAEAGDYARALGIDTLFTLGDLSATTSQHFGGGHHMKTMDDLKTAVLQAVPHASSILVKGSRFMKMERVVDAITAQTQTPEEAPCS